MAGSVTIGSLEIPGAYDPSSGNGYLLRSIGHPARLADRVYATSPWVDGDYLVAARRTQGSLALSVWIYADDSGTLLDRLTALQDEVDAFQYDVVVALDSDEITWSADMGDISLANEEWDGAFYAAQWQLVNLTIPVHPTAEYSTGGS